MRLSSLWKANIIAFISSFCVMVIELIAARLLSPYIGVSLYTWTSIIGVILAGIALGNFLGGKLADKRPSATILAAIFLVGSLLTIAILPMIKLVGSGNWFSSLPVMLNFTLKTTFIFFLPAIVLSMVSPMVIKLTLADLGKTGGIVGTIYACSTAGSILGTFMTGFFFIMWFGTRTIVWLAAGVLVLIGIISWFSWQVPNRWSLSPKRLAVWALLVFVVVASLLLYQFQGAWQVTYTKESNYYSINVLDGDANIKVLILDHLIHAYVRPNEPLYMKYDYLNVFDEVLWYTQKGNTSIKALHLGGGGYSFPRFVEAVYKGSTNDVVEIDPAVTEVAYEELGLPRDTTIKTYNQDARLFLIQRKEGPKYDVVVGDVFNDRSTPYHLTTLEFDRLVKANMSPNGVYMINTIDDYENSRYMASFMRTLKQVFKYVYLFNTGRSWTDTAGIQTFVIAATDQPIDLADYREFITDGGRRTAHSNPHDEAALEEYLIKQNAMVFTDDHVPTDILVAKLIR